MGLPQPLLDALRDMEPAERFDLAASLQEGTEASRRKKLARLREIVQDLETRPARIQAAMNALLQSADQEKTGPDLDQAIDLLFEHEEAMRKMAPHLEDVRVLKARAAAEGDPVVNLCDRWLQAFTAILEVLRDLRWELIAFRAEAETPGDAPVFDDAQDLLGYLKIPPK